MNPNRGLPARFASVAAFLALTLTVAGLNQPASAQTPVPIDQAGRLSEWVDLDLPALATVPGNKRAARGVLRSRIEAQQDAVMARLLGLGAQEQARVRQVRNAVAVWLPAEQIEAARLIPGVRAVRAVRHVDRDPQKQRG